jgi:hypothetical protein
MTDTAAGKPLAAREEKALSFDAALDNALERVWDRKARFSLKRLREMEAQLLVIEKELDMFLAGRPGLQAGSAG